MRRDAIMEGLWIFQDSEYRKTQKNKPMGLYISKAFFGGGRANFRGGEGLYSGGAYTRGKK